MSDLSLAQEKEIGRVFGSRALVVDGKGSLSVDGVVLLGLDGERTFQVAGEGVEQDALELGPAGAVKLYKRLAKTPGRLGKALKASQNLTRMIDADEVAGR